MQLIKCWGLNVFCWGKLIQEKRCLEKMCLFDVFKTFALPFTLIPIVIPIDAFIHSLQWNWSSHQFYFIPFGYKILFMEFYGGKLIGFHCSETKLNLLLLVSKFIMNFIYDQ